MRTPVLAMLLVSTTLLASSSCGGQNNSGQLGSETHWLGPCDSDVDCGKGQCLCGICTESCSGSPSCAGGVCVDAVSAGHAALCSDPSVNPDLGSVCIAPCAGPGDCGEGLECVAGACIPAPVLSTDSTCPIPDMPTSEEAIAGVQCRFHLSDDMEIVQLKSSANGDMRANGRSTHWIVEVRDQSAGVLRWFDVSGGDVNERGPFPDSAPDCLPPIPYPLSSSVVVPDAAARIRAKQSYRGIDFFILQLSDSCDAVEPKVAATYVTGLGIYGGPIDEDDWWFSFYDEQNRFQKLCGPCSSSIVQECHC